MGRPGRPYQNGNQLVFLKSFKNGASMRKTSLAALKKLKATRSLGKLYTLTLDTLAAKGPLTGQELDRAAKHKGLWKRLSELKAMGLIEEVEVRECKVTGRKALTWEVPDYFSKPKKEE